MGVEKGILVSLLLPAFLWLVLFAALSCRRRLRLPPGPLGLPFIGHLHMLGSRPHRSLYELSNKYGPLMYLRFGSVPVVVASSPATARLILQTHDQIFAWRPQPAVPMHLIGCKNVLFSQPCPYWKLARLICVTDLFGSKRLKSFRPLIAQETQALLCSIADAAHSIVPVRARLYTATSNIISRMALGNRLEELASRTQADPSCNLLTLLLEAIQLASVFNVGDFIPWLAWLDLQGCVQRSKMIKPKLESVWREIIDGRRNLRRKHQADFLDVLLAASEQNDEQMVMGILMDVFGAGIDSSSITVEWALSELLTNSHLMKKVQDELEEVVGASRLVCESDIQHLPYLRAIVKETMRLHPVIPLLVPHRASKQCNISGFDIPLNTLAYINVWAIGRDPHTWDKALDFYPERFLNSNLDVRGQHFELLPFGSGRRACPGLILGLNNVYIMLASLLQAFSWTTMQKPNMSENFGIVMTLAEPLQAKAIVRIPRELFEAPIRVV